MDGKKRQRYLAISKKLTELVGGEANIQGVAHCATRLRIVLENNDKADLKAIEDLDLAKGVFVAGDQLQIIFGAGLVNDVYEVFTEYTGKQNMSLSDLKTEANKKMNPVQRVIKALSDVFIDIMLGSHYDSVVNGGAFDGAFRGAGQFGCGAEQRDSVRNHKAYQYFLRGDLWFPSPGRFLQRL